ncbi:MAG: PEGA domain-containing protein [Polyangiaceae bacterium]|nr:PEGA domain-containing protein [Polyangiaceae bacterium]
MRTLLTVAGLTLIPTTAFAQIPPDDDPYSNTPPAPAPDVYDTVEKEEAMKRHDDGLAFVREGKWEHALLELRAAWEGYKFWKIALNLGFVELQLRKYRAAVEHLTFAKTSGKIKPGDLPRIEAAIEQATAVMGKVTVRATANLRAKVLLDGEELGWTPFEQVVMVDPGTRRLTVESQGFLVQRMVDVRSGQPSAVEMKLHVPLPSTQAAPPAAPPPPPAPNYKLPIAVTLSALTATGLGAGITLSAVQPEDTPAMVGVFSLTGAGALSAAILWYVIATANPPSPSKSAWTFAPTVGPTHAGLTLHTLF